MRIKFFLPISIALFTALIFWSCAPKGQSSITEIVPIVGDLVPDDQVIPPVVIPPPVIPVALVCPQNFIKISPLSGYTSNEFCVAAFEMKNEFNTAVSKATDSPWVNITHLDAVSACQSLGPKYDLISNDEWQTIAREIESVGFNLGAIQFSGNGYNMGNFGLFEPNQPANLTDPCDGVNSAPGVCDFLNYNFYSRAHKLANNEFIWDISGNALEWVKDDFDDSYSIVLPTTDTAYSNSLGDYDLVFAGSSDYPFLPPWAQSNFGSAIDRTGNNDRLTTYKVGIGLLRGDNYSGVSMNVRRGENGIFATRFTPANFSDAKTGFRCVYK